MDALRLPDGFVGSELPVKPKGADRPDRLHVDVWSLKKWYSFCRLLFLSLH